MVRQERGRDAALSAIDSSQLSFMLTLSSDPSELFLQVGSAWLDESGHFQSDPPKLHSKFALILASQRYPSPSTPVMPCRSTGVPCGRLAICS